MPPGKDAEMLARGFKALLRLERGRLIAVVESLEREVGLRFYPTPEEQEEGLLGAGIGSDEPTYNLKDVLKPVRRHLR